MKDINYFYNMYNLSESEINIIEGYAEGHDLELKVINNELKLIDIQSDNDEIWADGILDIIHLLMSFNDDLIENNEIDNIDRLESLENDRKILNKLHERI